MLDVPAYLARIDYSGTTSPTAETLRALHRAHMMSVPFENLDIGLGRKIVCDEGSFLRKIVECQRGGFCYEMNGAFSALLRELGFRVTLLSARVFREDGTTTPEFDHLALRIGLDEPWLADVGFGDSFNEPLHLKLGEEQDQDGRKFRIVEDGESLLMQRHEPEEDWKGQYSFTLTPRRIEEFAAMCEYHQTWPESPFTRKRVCSRATANGRITLADGRLIVTRNRKKEESNLSPDEWDAALKHHFGIVL